jgi:hypothetical protein
MPDLFPIAIIAAVLLAFAAFLRSHKGRSAMAPIRGAAPSEAMRFTATMRRPRKVILPPGWG